MVKIFDNYSLSADAKNIILVQENIVEDEKSKNFGKKVKKELGYFRSVDLALEYLLQLIMRDKIEHNKVKTLNTMLNEYKKIKDELQETLNKYKGATSL